jgi:hypothetical protein
MNTRYNYINMYTKTKINCDGVNFIKLCLCESYEEFKIKLKAIK